MNKADELDRINEKLLQVAQRIAAITRQQDRRRWRGDQEALKKGWRLWAKRVDQMNDLKRRRDILRRTK